MRSVSSTIFAKGRTSAPNMPRTKAVYCSALKAPFEAASKGAFNAEQYTAFVRGMLGAEVRPFAKMVEDTLLIARLLDLELNAPAAHYRARVEPTPKAEPA